MSVRIDENTDHMKYTDDMEAIDSDIMDRVIAEMNSYDADIYTAKDVKEALAAETCSVDNFKALLSPAALPFLEEIAQKAQKETRKHFGNSVAIFTPLYIANYCENYCVYCGFNCHNKIKRAQLNAEEIEKEMQAIAETGLEEVLILTGESPNKSSVEYIGEACKIAKKYFKLIGLEVYPMDSKDYAYLHECGADFVTVFQETYNSDKYKTLHLGGRKRIFPYRLNAQERAIMGGMRGVGFAALLGLDDFRKDALATGMHAYLLQIICAYRIFMPFASITISTRECERFRDNIIQIAATKISAGVNVGIGGHSQEEEKGDEQFEISDGRSVDEIYQMIEDNGMQPVMTDYIYV